MSSLHTDHALLLTAAWYGINGVLHDTFVLRQHTKSYDRDLLRLLMDGHVLLLSAAIMLVSWLMVRQGLNWGYLTGAIVTLFMIIYCLMIFPFLKSFGTLIISFAVLLICIVRLIA
jgi:hypothetical protein